jgi:hypothetical protein
VPCHATKNEILIVDHEEVGASALVGASVLAEASVRVDLHGLL